MFPRRGHRKRDREEGQALTELAIVLPILAILFATIFDVGRYLMITGYIDGAADSAARYYEYNGGATETQLADSIAQGYPTLDPASISVTITEEPQPSESYTHRFYKDGSFTGETHETKQLRTTIAVGYSDRWFTPVPLAVTAAGGYGTDFTITVEKTAVVDKTIEVW